VLEGFKQFKGMLELGIEYTKLIQVMETRNNMCLWKETMAEMWMKKF